jgi:hypothetical protein
MYKLKQELPKEFKIKVNPEQSEALQKHMISIGFKSLSIDNKVSYVNYPYVYFRPFNKYLSADSKSLETKKLFESSPLLRIKFKDYFEKETSFHEKWCILVTHDNYKELNTWMHRNWENYQSYRDSWEVNIPKLSNYNYYFISCAKEGGHSLCNLPKYYTLITTEQFRAKYGKEQKAETKDDAIEFFIDQNKVSIKDFAETLPIKIQRLQSENEQLKKYNEQLTDQVGMYYKQVLMLTEKLETIKKVLE